MPSPQDQNDVTSFAEKTKKPDIVEAPESEQSPKELRANKPTETNDGQPTSHPALQAGKAPAQWLASVSKFWRSRFFWPACMVTLLALVALYSNNVEQSASVDVQLEPLRHPPPPPPPIVINTLAAKDFAGSWLERQGANPKTDSSKIDAVFVPFDKDLLALGLQSSLQDAVEFQSPIAASSPQSDLEEMHRIERLVPVRQERLRKAFISAELELANLGPASIPELEAYISQAPPKKQSGIDATLFSWKQQLCCRAIARFGAEGVQPLLRIIRNFTDSDGRENLIWDQNELRKEAYWCLIDIGAPSFDAATKLALSENRGGRNFGHNLLITMIPFANLRSVYLPPSLTPMITADLQQPRDIMWGNRMVIRELGCIYPPNQETVKRLLGIMSDDQQQGNSDSEAARALAVIAGRGAFTQEIIPPLRKFECQSDPDAAKDKPDELFDRAIDKPFFMGSSPNRIITTSVFNSRSSVRELCGPIKAPSK
jgi:hypothetical protein